MPKNELNERREEMEALVEEVKKGDQNAFSELYEILVGPIYRYVFYRVNDQDAEDIVENVFVKVWLNIRKYRRRKKQYFSAWVFRIAHNLVVDYYRTASKRQTDELHELVADDRREHNPIKNTEQTIQHANLRKALKVLKKPYQDVVIYKFINGMENFEIAQIMKRSEGSVRI